MRPKARCLYFILFFSLTWNVQYTHRKLPVHAVLYTNIKDCSSVNIWHVFRKYFEFIFFYFQQTYAWASITNILFFRSWCNDTCWVLVNFFMRFLGIYFEADFFLDFFLSYHSSPFYVCFAMIYLFVLQPTPLNFVKKVFIVSFCAHFYHSLKYLQLGVKESVLKCEDKFKWVCQLNGFVMFLILKLSLKAFMLFSWYVIKLN